MGRTAHCARVVSTSQCIPMNLRPLMAATYRAALLILVMFQTSLAQGELRIRSAGHLELGSRHRRSHL